MDWHPSRRRGFQLLGIVALLYLVLAYLALPALWRHHEHEPGLAELPMVTRTSTDIPGDALNVGLVGSQEDLLRAMQAAGWFPADPVTLRTSIAIVGSVVLDRPYHDAPVSPLYYQGKKEQLAFEKPDGKSADRRHHVRFWQVLKKGTDGRPVWLGAVTYDRGVGLSHYTGQVTHHIGADIDAERHLLMRDLTAAGMLDAVFQISGIGPTLFGRNGGGDPYYTDGEIEIGSLVANGVKRTEPPASLPPPALIALKDQIWHDVGDAIGQ
ncbi:MAG: LssY C-terminal domain-containing protein [Bradyrhizobium sp.]|uniref:LssY C-terminal domain-containing protein n=1 Tax=Bradyrhizobium sp. TaxID=376 RepID=UPI001C292E18|nr:LssY C-terminal domain-containing protein [Bradyrhizobium sp.]MBU6461821.1 LssY C-terminal domain-containing protein [Pseudomonadota bacterium]MDE2066142.1 LssY C-terminal domain-containing protein [Bradyrhizobium sp.]MDE2243229.1 LssY C-terminal domain-containing protein [Bradyrhizobium sp.]MDE2467435.1 LssY C-terminal domain-containing protein [Bradyrhizobium sp.]